MTRGGRVIQGGAWVMITEGGKGGEKVGKGEERQGGKIRPSPVSFSSRFLVLKRSVFRGNQFKVSEKKQ